MITTMYRIPSTGLPMIGIRAPYRYIEVFQRRLISYVETSVCSWEDVVGLESAIDDHVRKLINVLYVAIPNT